MPIHFLAAAGHHALAHRFPTTTPLALSTLGFHGCNHTGQLQDACLGCFRSLHAYIMCCCCVKISLCDTCHGIDFSLPGCRRIELSAKREAVATTPKNQPYCKGANGPLLSPARMPLTSVCRSAFRVSTTLLHVGLECRMRTIHLPLLALGRTLAILLAVRPGGLAM